MRTVRVKCVFVAPLLVDRMSDETLEELRTGVRAKKQKDRPAKEVAAEKIYHEWFPGEEGHEDLGPIGLPAGMLFASSVRAGQNVKNGKKQVSTAKASTLPDFMSVEELFVPLMYEGKPVTEEHWSVDKRRGRLQDGTAICIVRPKFRAGCDFEFTINYEESKVDDTTVKAIIANAGSAQGIGSFRPNCRGQFGRFRLKTVKQDGVEGWEVSKKEVEQPVKKVA